MTKIKSFIKHTYTYQGIEWINIILVSWCINVGAQVGALGSGWDRHGAHRQAESRQKFNSIISFTFPLNKFIHNSLILTNFQLRRSKGISKSWSSPSRSITKFPFFRHDWFSETLESVRNEKIWSSKLKGNVALWHPQVSSNLKK